MKDTSRDIIIMNNEALDNIKFNSRYNILDLNSLILLMDVTYTLNKSISNVESTNTISSIRNRGNIAHNSVNNISISNVNMSYESVLMTDDNYAILTSSNNILQL